MKNENLKKLIRICKFLIVIGFMSGTFILAVYPIENQAISVTVVTDQGNIIKEFSANEIAEADSLVIELPENFNAEIMELRLYRHFRSICIDRILFADLAGYSKISSNTVILNDITCSLLRRHSSSYLMERLIWAEMLLAVVMFLWILINAAGEKLDSDDRNNHGPVFELKRFFSDMKKYGQYMIYAAKADLKAEVANSYLNRLWWLLEPLFNMFVYVIVFGRIMGRSVENYATFVFSALLMWNYFSKTINYSVKCIRFNKDIVTKVYVPKHVLLLSDMFLNFFKLLFSLIVLIPMLIIFEVHIGLYVIWVLPPYILMILLAFGAGMIFLHYGVYVDDLAYAVGILLQMLMFMSGIFYDVITSLSSPLNDMVMCLNPVAMFIDTMRNALLDNSITNLPLLGVWLALAILLCYIGIHTVYKNENGYVKVV